MAFQRKIINQNSTFTTGNEVIQSSTPTFQLWENQTNVGDALWDLGNKWKVSTVSTDDKLKFQRDGVTVFTITSSGFDGDLNLNSLKLQTWTTLPAASAYSAGDIVKSDGTLYMASEE